MSVTQFHIQSILFIPQTGIITRLKNGNAVAYLSEGTLCLINKITPVLTYNFYLRSLKM
jgi:hypothetical protein